jgi:hypothetical protein
MPLSLYLIISFACSISKKICSEDLTQYAGSAYEGPFPFFPFFGIRSHFLSSNFRAVGRKKIKKISPRLHFPRQGLVQRQLRACLKDLQDERMDRVRIEGCKL